MKKATAIQSFQFYTVCRFPGEENLYYFAECDVDISDSWIEKDSVMAYIGMTQDDFDATQFAIGCIEYYGAENFSYSYAGYKFTKEEIEDKLKYYPIENNEQ